MGLEGAGHLPLFRGRFPAQPKTVQVASRAPFEPCDPSEQVLLNAPMVSEKLPDGGAPRSGVAGGADIVLAADAPAPLPFVVPEVQVLIPVDRANPQAATDPHGTALVLPLFRGRSTEPISLPGGPANPSLAS